MAGWMRYHPPSVFFLIALCAGSVIFSLTGFLLPDRYGREWIKGMTLSVAMGMMGLALAGFNHARLNRLLERANRHDVCLIRLTDDLVEGNSSFHGMARIMFRRARKDWVSDHTRIKVYFSKDCISRPQPGWIMVAHIRYRVIGKPKNPCEFDYSRYLWNQGVCLQTYLSKSGWHRVAGSRSSDLKSVALAIRKKMIGKYAEIGLPESDFNLLAALTLGYKSDLDAGIREIYTRAGVMHIMALSGFNVGIVVWVVSFILSPVRRSSRMPALHALIAISAVWVFAFVTGLSPSVLRAACMTTAFLTGNMLHRQVNMGNLLLVSAFVLLAISPGLVGNIGFQLSFLAVTGILLFQPWFDRLFTFRFSPATRLWQLFSLSVAAQLGTLPLTLHYFHQFPVYFWLTNLYVVPLVSCIIAVAFVFLAAGWIGPAGTFTGWVLFWMLRWLNTSVSWVQNLPGSLAENIRLGLPESIILLVLILSIGLFLISSGNRAIYLVLLSITALLGFSVLNEVKGRKLERLLVASIKNTTALQITGFRQSLLLMRPLNQQSVAQASRSLSNYQIANGLKKSIQFLAIDSLSGMNAKLPPGVTIEKGWLGNNLLIAWHGIRYLWMGEIRLAGDPFPEPVPVEVLILSGAAELNPDAILQFVNPRSVVLDSSVDSYKSTKWTNLFKSLGIDCWSTTVKGFISIDPGNTFLLTGQ